ncbi:nSTAND1 domain-containing NTPase [Planotetraspora kaengkrachanensis]|uniref:Novel STAND NTPase 1 domain-containing protein n=1 Tax=Planotetraspora kaengkrachanensis TaxID=575193 RepID=A0A8J3VAF3_9ACTN|nr:tetratricopeptide repeat protein [Planotetraspora kaengkrachanensis]GIG83322.1 hypothetical protein Pka01_64490 [Planotetraspora kaengkrachanensis]
METSGRAHHTRDPYVGLRPFLREDSHLFFGRDRERHELSDLWQANRLTILHGASGVGKSSLIHAGVLPLLDPNKTDVLPVGRLSRGMTVPTAVLPDGGNPHVFALLSSWAPFTPPTQIAGITITEFLRRSPAKTDPYGDPLLTMLVIDQVEDLFADFGRRRHHCEGFLAQLAAALDSHPHARLLVAVSDDHLASVLKYGDRLAAIGHGRFAVGALTVTAALDACRRPLEETERSFAPGAAEALVDDLRTVRLGRPVSQKVVEIRDTVEPVQLQVVCAELWRSLPDDHDVITIDDVRASNVDRTLADYCDQMIDEVAGDHFNGETEKLRLRLRQIFINDLGTREIVYRGMTETSGLPNAVIRALADRHILRIEEDPVGGWVELSHDRLIQPLLRGGPIKRGDERSDPTEYLRAAELAMSEGQFGLAAKHAEEALRHIGTDTRLQGEIESFLGNIYDLAGNARESISHYRSAVQLFASLRGTDGAIAALLTAIARLCMRQGDLATALSELRAAVRQNPADLGVQTTLAWALWHSGRANAALDVLGNALNLEGNTAEALRARGEMYADLGEAGKAIQDLERVLPHHLPSTRAAYALALAMNGDVSEAMRLVPPTDREQDPAVLLRVARVLKSDGQHEKAAQLASRARRSTAQPGLPPHVAKVANQLSL